MKYSLFLFLILLQLSCSKDCEVDSTEQNQEELINPNLTGRVWNDADGDGIQDAEEDGIDDIKVDIVDSETDMVITSLVTDTAGLFSIELDQNVNYYLKLSLGGNPMKYAPSQADYSSNTFDDIDNDLSKTNGYWTTDAYSSNSDNDLDLGVTVTGSISGIMWEEDRSTTMIPNNYSALDDVLLEGQLVKLFKIDFQTGVETFNGMTRTDSVGYYNFDYILHGISTGYFLEFEIENNFRLSYVSPNSNNDEVTDSDVVEVFDSSDGSKTLGRTVFLLPGPSENIEWVSAGITLN